MNFTVKSRSRPPSWFPPIFRLGVPGFTLIELSVVLLIMTLMFSIAVPRFSELTEFNLRSTARQLAAMMRYLYSEAAFKKTYYSLVFDLASKTFWVEAPRLNPLTQEMQMLEIEDQALIQRRKLPAGIRFSEIKVGSREALHDGRVEMHFFPGGYADPATVHLKDRKDREYSIFLVPLSGRVLVRSGYFEFSEFAP